jgi:hypothetical protein
MKTSSAVLLLGALTVGLIVTPRAVGAYEDYQEVTSTPEATTTVTAPPAYQPQILSTQDLGDLSCPPDGSNPVGWGTVTPSSGWNLLCSQCVSQSEWATSTPADTATPNPTYVYLTQAACQTAAPGGEPCITSTPTVTPLSTTTMTSTPSSNIVFTGGSLVSTGSVYFSDTAEFQRTWSRVLTSDLVTFSGYVGIRDASTTRWDNRLVDFQTTYTGSGYVYWNADFVESHENATLNSVSLILHDNDGDEIIDLINNPIGSAYLSSSGTIFYRLSYNSKNPFMSYSIPAAEFTDNGTVISNVPFEPTPTPTVTPTASPLGYCQSVSNVESGFSWSGITYGETYCQDIGPYGGFDFNGLTANPIGAFPWIAHLCLQDVSFGNAVIFDVEISLEVVLYILGIVAIIRNLFVS